jgi:hypothetical protein
MQELNITVPLESEPKRLDAFLMEFSDENKLGFSRTFLQNLIRESRVFDQYSRKKDPESRSGKYPAKDRLRRR